MTAFINYLLEANLGLCFFILLYWLLLRDETDFSLKRVFLLLSIAISLIFPFFHFSTEARIVPAIGGLIPTTWLPEFVVYGNEGPLSEQTNVNLDAWLVTQTVYSIGVVITLLIFVARLFLLIRLIRTAPSYPIDNFKILESPRSDDASFSFFNFIFIGNSAELSEHEKALIIEHERIHAQRLHSFDVLLTNFLGVLFWFNPVIRIYKKIFVHLHEYEADARSVKFHDVNDYCSLLAKVALLSADIRLANHFSNSLTLKRIQMIRKIRSKTKWWKVAVIGATIPLFFFAVACQDQLAGDITEIARNTNMAFDAPQAIVDRFEAVKKANPNSTYLLVEFNEEADRLLEKMEKAHGIPKSIELFTPDKGSYKNGTMNTSPEKISFNQSKEWEIASQTSGERTFAIIEYNEMVKQVAANARDENGVYTIVDEPPTPENGMPSLYGELAQKMFYPLEARQKGLEGTVYVEYVVLEDGSLTDVNAKRGIGGGCDEAAVAAVKAMNIKWIPGKVDGASVKSKMILPIAFKLDNTPALKEEETPEKAMEKMVVIGKLKQQQ